MKRRLSDTPGGLTFVTLLESLDVSQVLEAARALLVLDEVAARHDMNGLIVVRRSDSLGPGVIEIDAVDRRDYVDANRCNADLEDELRRSQIVRG